MKVRDSSGCNDLSTLLRMQITIPDILSTLHDTSVTPGGGGLHWGEAVWCAKGPGEGVCACGGGRGSSGWWWGGCGVCGRVGLVGEWGGSGGMSLIWLQWLLISFATACHIWVTNAPLNTPLGCTLSPMQFICFRTWHQHTQHWSIMVPHSRSTKCLTQHMENLCTCWQPTWFETSDNGKQRWYTMTKYVFHKT